MDAASFENIFHRCLNGTATPEEREELLMLLPENEAHFKQLVAASFFKLEPEEDTLDETAEAIMQSIFTSVSATSEKKGIGTAHRIHFLRTSWFRYAAAIMAVLAGVAIYIYFFTDTRSAPGLLQSTAQKDPVKVNNSHPVLTLADGSVVILDSTASDKLAGYSGTYVLDTGRLKFGENLTGADGYNTISTPKGRQFQVMLPDGSRIWLNAASSVKFPASVSAKERSIEITGEVYLEVAKNSHKPFSVKARGTEVQVLGTSFNINAYDDELMVATTLIEGSVKVVSLENGSSALLKEGQQAICKDATPVKVVSQVDPKVIIAWKNGIFSFKNAPLELVVRHLMRWYDVEVEYKGNIPAYRFGGEIPKTSNLTEVLKILSNSGVTFSMNGKKIIVGE